MILFDWNDLLSPSVLIFMIPIVAIIMGGIVAGIVAAVMLPIFRANLMAG